MNPANPMDSLYYIHLPADFSFSAGALHIDAAIPLPVQKKDGAEEFDVKELQEEQILSGILTVLAYDASNQYVPYYRKLLLGARPNIKKELSQAAILKAKNEDWDLAEEIWRALSGLDPENKAIVLNIGIFFDQRADSYRRNNLHEDADAYDALALSHYNSAMDSEPEIPDAFFNAAYFYLKKKNFIDAKGCFENYVALTADLDDEELGAEGLEKKRIAEETIEKINNRNLEDVHFHKAYELISTGREEEGLTEIRRFIQDNPAVWNAWFLLGWGLRRLGRFADAKMAFEKARECDGGDENADTLNELAICQMETGDLHGAKESLYAALSLEPENTKIISNLGYLYIKLGDEAQARSFFVTVLELDPQDKIAKMQLEALEAEV